MEEPDILVPTLINNYIKRGMKQLCLTTLSMDTERLSSGEI